MSVGSDLPQQGGSASFLLFTSALGQMTGLATKTTDYQQQYLSAWWNCLGAPVIDLGPSVPGRNAEQDVKGIGDTHGHT